MGLGVDRTGVLLEVSEMNCQHGLDELLGLRTPVILFLRRNLAVSTYSIHHTFQECILILGNFAYRGLCNDYFHILLIGLDSGSSATLAHSL